MPVSLVRKDGQVFDDVDDAEAGALVSSGDFVPEGPQQRPATNVGRAVNLGTGERARASIRDWAAGIGITDPGNHSDPQFTGIPLTVPAEPTVGGRIKSGLSGLNPLNIADPELLSDPTVGGPKTLLNILAAVAAGKAMPKGAKVTPGAQALIESGATRDLANSVRLPAGAGISSTQLGQALESTRSYATAARKGTAAGADVAMPSNATELINTLRDAAKSSKSSSHSKVLNTLADLGERRISEVADSPQGIAQLKNVGAFNTLFGLARTGAAKFVPGFATEEMLMNKWAASATRKAMPAIPRGWNRWSRPAVGSLTGSVVGTLSSGDYVRGRGARIGSAR